jgi:proteic killer suppression protein
LKSLHFEKLQGSRVGQYSMRLNDQWRLIIKFKSKGGDKTVLVISIEDYH